MFSTADMEPEESEEEDIVVAKTAVENGKFFFIVDIIFCLMH